MYQETIELETKQQVLKPSNRFYVQGTETAAHGIDTEGIK
jgi:hypothetical protein